MIAIALTSVVLFLIAFFIIGIVPVAIQATHTAKSAMHSMRDPELDDDQREKIVQKASIGLFGAFFSILVRSAIALLVAAAPIVAADWSGYVPSDDVFNFLARWDVIFGLTVIITVLWWLKAKLRPGR